MTQDETSPVKIRGDYNDVLTIAHDRIENTVLLCIDEHAPPGRHGAIFLQPKEALAAAKAIIGIMEGLEA